VAANARVDFVSGSRASGVIVRAESPGGAAPLDLQALIKARAHEWTTFFSQWLATLNRRNAGLHWWAYTSTAKNLLSSPLGNRLLEVLAIRELASLHRGRLEVEGATPGQMDAVAALTRGDGVAVVGSAYRWRGLRRMLRLADGLLRQLQQAMRVWFGFAFSAAAAWRDLDLCLFTYVDAPRRAGADGYFGPLHTLLTELRPQLRVGHAAYVYAPYRRRLREFRRVDGERTFALFGLLTAADLASACWRSMRALFPRQALAGASPSESALAPLLEECLIEDVALGGYQHNVLVHHAMRRFVAKSTVTTLIYPYENKSLEKSLLLGARAGKPGIRLIGYQHTSITARHVTLRFEPGEADITPLPDRIITVGEATRKHLERHGNYPRGIFQTGCALRQVWDAVLPRNRHQPPRLLLALSSSRSELVEAVAFMRTAAQQFSLEIRVRTHPNFPIALLPADLFAWVSNDATDLSGTDLAGNLLWCDAVAYVSSTVALEALMRGRPVINLRVSDPIDPDPLLETAPLAWKVDSPGKLADVLRQVGELSDEEFSRRQNQSVEKMKAYFAPISTDGLSPFLPS
jgi:hypothetical protein